MNLVFANPWGFLALLGIPLLVLVYYLRRRAKVVAVSTVFLLKRTQRESKGGRRFENFTNSLPFWLQILTVLLLTWILVQPKYGNRRITRQIAIVMDSSASMQPVKKDLEEKLSAAFAGLKGSADEASYFVLDHDPRRPRIYQGDDVDVLMDRLEEWNPTDGALEPTGSLRIARTLVGPDGVVVYVTDHEGDELPFLSERLALGEAKANCGFTGVTVEEEGEGFVWTAVVRNYGDSPQSREWVMETLDRRKTEPRVVELPPRQLTVLKGGFPDGSDRFFLRLEEDAMPLDDVVPVIVKKPQVARLRVTGNEEVRELGARVVRGFRHVEAAGSEDEAEMVMTSAPSGDEPGSGQPMILFYDQGEESRPPGKWLVGQHALTKGLNFQALTVRSLEQIEQRSDDQVLLWLGESPAVLLRIDPVSRAPQLVFLFPLAGSNAMKIPAVAVLLHRFCEEVARGTLTVHTAVLETGQLLSNEFPPQAKPGDVEIMATDANGKVTKEVLLEGFRRTQRAPREPGFLSLRYQGEEFLEAAVVFADTREADLAKATSTELPDMEPALVARRVSEDRWWRVVALATLIVVLAAWVYLGPKKRKEMNS